MRKSVSFIMIIFFLYACTKETPKPIGYNRIERLDNSYLELHTQYFSFLYSSQAYLDSVRSVNVSDQWFNIIYPEYNARIYCTYIPINKITFKKVLEDSYRLAYSHTLKAEGINQIFYKDPVKRISGIMYEIDGNVATPIQFFITDSISSFFRGSLYYDIPVNPDSISPVTEYIKGDIVRLIETFEWN